MVAHGASLAFFPSLLLALSFFSLLSPSSCELNLYSVESVSPSLLSRYRLGVLFDTDVYLSLPTSPVVLYSSANLTGTIVILPQDVLSDALDSLVSANDRGPTAILIGHRWGHSFLVSTFRSLRFPICHNFSLAFFITQ